MTRRNALLEAIGHLAPQMRANAGALVLVFLLGLIAAATEFAGIGAVILLIQMAFDQGGELNSIDLGIVSFGSGDLPEWMREPLGAGIVVLLFVLLRLAANAGHGLVSARVAASLEHQARVDALENNLATPYQDEQGEGWGEAFTLITGHSQAISEGIDSVINLLQTLTVVVVLGSLVLFASPIIAASGLLFALSFNLIFATMQRRAERTGTDLANRSELLNAKLIRILQAKRTFRTLGLIDREQAQFRERSEDTARLQCEADKLAVLTDPLSQVAILLSVGLTGLVSVWLSISITTLLLIAGLLYRTQPYLASLAEARLTLITLLGPLRRLRQMDKRTAADEGYHIDAIPGEIRFENVGFRYLARSEPVLKHLNFRIPLGGTVSIEGPSGIGKSTIVDMLLRLIEPDQGSIFAGTIPLEAIHRGCWRSFLTVCGQKSELIHGTVRDNVTLGNEEATQAEVDRAIHLAGFDLVVKQLPNGLDEPLGERGMQLSGGQSQRLAIARSILRKPDILILDEALSMLDPQSQKRILTGLAEELAGRTLVVIGHNISLHLPGTVSINLQELLRTSSPAGVITVAEPSQRKALPILRTLSD